jgi:hypothetical protein
MRSFWFFTLFIVFSLPDSYSQTSYMGQPFGFVKMDIVAGSGSSRKVSLISIPLHGNSQFKGAETGSITSFSSSSITFSSAGWVPGELSNRASPHALLMTSGAQEGRMFIISSTLPNTTDTLYFDGSEFVGNLDFNLLSLSVGDSFRIILIETLSSFFGSPESTLILGGNSSAQADVVTLINNGSALSYYFNTSLNRWARVSLGNPDASHVPLLPYYGVQYSRLANTPLQFLVTGTVPEGKRIVPIRASGSTLLSQYWVTQRTLSSLGLNTISGWRSGSNAVSSDIVLALRDGSASSFFHDGTNWRRLGLGNPIANDFQLPIGSSVLLNRKGSTSDYSLYQQAAPY